MLDGLTRPFKELPPKHLYDARGSELFDRICELPEYYPTRTERAILDRSRIAIVRRTGMAELVELGSGTAAKTRVLLDAMDARRDALALRAVRRRRADRARLRRGARRRVPGAGRSTASSATSSATCATIPPPEPRPPARGRVPRRHDRQLPARAPAAASCARSPACCRPGDYLLLGTDLVKDVDVLEAAYDDAAGVTAEFNRNVLHVLNRELDADFPTELFEHVAFFDPDHEWIEMRLRARRACHVRDRRARPRGRLRARRGAAHRDLGQVHAASASRPTTRPAGLELAEWFTDDDGLFALSLALSTGTV